MNVVGSGGNIDHGSTVIFASLCIGLRGRLRMNKSFNFRSFVMIFFVFVLLFWGGFGDLVDFERLCSFFMEYLVENSGVNSVEDFLCYS